jgi:hypothetical protein
MKENGQLRRGTKGIVTKDEYQRGNVFCQEAVINRACQVVEIMREVKDWEITR